MGATAAAFVEFFASSAAAGGAGSVGAAAGAATASAATAGAGASLSSIALQAGATALGTGLITKALAPGAPDIKGPTPMPDPLEQQRAKERSIIEQMARRGRSASILTDAAGTGTLGGG